jgi:hypothetical protein
MKRSAVTYDGLGRRVSKQRLDGDGAVVERTRFVWEGDVRQLGPSRELVDELASCNARYQRLIPLDLEARRSQMGVVDPLDQQGLTLAERVASALPRPAKVQCYSEGRLRRVP